MRYFLVLVFLVCSIAQAEPKKKPVYRKTQEVSFDATDIDGVVRSPDGAYLLQKRGVKFMPLYKVQKHFDDEIKNSVDYLR
ncbi:MAG: hypothetical protein KDD43_08485 [Bdellovibrionales bacterium]|nr:hypothetical protein [Bdellovibrionales bacterium]